MMGWETLYSTGSSSSQHCKPYLKDKTTAASDSNGQSAEETNELSNYVGALLLRHITQLICNASAIQHVLPEEDFGDVADVGEMGGDLTECVRQASV